MNARELLTATEIAVVLNVSRRTIQEWARREVIPSVRLSHKIIRFDRDAVVQALTAKGASDAR